MPKPPSTWTQISIGLSRDEKEHLDECVAKSGKSRNRFIRDLIAAVRRKDG